MPAWWGWVGIALVPVLLAALAQWLIEAKDHADESALDHVTASYEYYVLGLMALTVALILWHYLHARRDLFVARGDRGDKAEEHLAYSERQRADVERRLAKVEGERDDARTQAAVPHYNVGTMLKVDVSTPEDASRVGSELAKELEAKEPPPDST